MILFSTIPFISRFLLSLIRTRNSFNFLGMVVNLKYLKGPTLASYYLISNLAILCIFFGVWTAFKITVVLYGP